MSCYDYEVDTKADKNELALSVGELKLLLKKSLDDFVAVQQFKLEEFCTDLENDDIIASDNY
jgi:hypothetical protein